MLIQHGLAGRGGHLEVAIVFGRRVGLANSRVVVIFDAGEGTVAAASGTDAGKIGWTHH